MGVVHLGLALTPQKPQWGWVKDWISGWDDTITAAELDVITWDYMGTEAILTCPKWMQKELQFGQYAEFDIKLLENKSSDRINKISRFPS